MWDGGWKDWEKQLLVGKKSFSVLSGFCSQLVYDVPRQGEPQGARIWRKQH